MNAGSIANQSIARKLAQGSGTGKETRPGNTYDEVCV